MAPLGSVVDDNLLMNVDGPPTETVKTGDVDVIEETLSSLPPAKKKKTASSTGVVVSQNNDTSSGIENDIDISLTSYEKVLADSSSDSGSDAEEEEEDMDEVDNLVGPTDRRNRNASEFPAFVDPDDLDDLADELLNVDTAEDNSLVEILKDPDLLLFDWKSIPAHFKGVREVFTGPSGPTFPAQGQTPVQIFKKVWDDEVIDKIVYETNRYAYQLRQGGSLEPSSSLHQWEDVTKNEVWAFFSILMMQSIILNSVEKEYWYPRYSYLHIGNFADIMSYERFLLLKKCLHFVDNTTFPGTVKKLDKIRPIVDHLNSRFQSLYMPERMVALDDSLLLWNGKLSFAQIVSNKKAKRIKSYEIYDAKSGYLWAINICKRKNRVSRDDTLGPLNESEETEAQIILNLMRPLFNRGHTLVMDNFYNSPLLSRVLKAQYKTDTMGTLRLNRKFYPDVLKRQQKTRHGEVLNCCTNDLNVLIWRDSNLVSMISTYHSIEVDVTEKLKQKNKPKLVLDYNVQMGGIDKKDQMLSDFPMERTRNASWYKKLFRRLLNVSIHNTYVLYCHNRKIGNRDFRMQLSQEILREFKGQLPLMKRPPPTPPSANGHYPTKNEKQQRCKLCALANKRKSTIFKCCACNANLCVEGCFAQYHTQLLDSEG